MKYSGQNTLSYLLNKIKSLLETKANVDHNHSVATDSSNGYMSSDMVKKLGTIEEGANKYILPTATTSLGGVKTTSKVNDTTGHTATPIVDGVPYYKNVSQEDYLMSDIEFDKLWSEITE